MPIPGIAPFSGQPSLTNPLSPLAQQVGSTTQAQSGNETQNTVTAQEQESTATNTPGVVEQTNESDEANFNTNSRGSIIDITA